MRNGGQSPASYPTSTIAFTSLLRGRAILLTWADLWPRKNAR